MDAIANLRALVERRLYDEVRLQLQKISYGMVGRDVPEDERQRFKQFMSEFAQVDPLYREVIAQVKPFVLDHPGMLQSALYARFPAYGQETLRYVLYFAHELGEIHRRKKGRSYELLPPGRVIDPG